MEKHMKECAKVFLRDQKKLFDEPVVYDLEEAEDFLEECFAQTAFCPAVGCIKIYIIVHGSAHRASYVFFSHNITS